MNIEASSTIAWLSCNRKCEWKNWKYALWKWNSSYVWSTGNKD